MNRLWKDVRKFHRAFGHPAPKEVTFLDQERVNKRADWINSEVQELRDATTVKDQADACIDIIYFAIGCLVEMGLRPAKLWIAVQAANMRKLWPDGKPVIVDGRVRKPPGWVGPDDDLEAEIERQRAA